MRRFPGAMPQALDDATLLALNRYVLREVDPPVEIIDAWRERDEVAL